MMVLLSFFMALSMPVLALAQSQAMEYLAWGGIAALGLVLLALLTLLLGANFFAIKLIRQVLIIPADRALAPFGLTPTGQSIYSLLGQVGPLLDDPSDKLPIWLSQNVTAIKKTPAEWSNALATGFKYLHGLFDGVPLEPETVTDIDDTPPKEAESVDGGSLPKAPSPGAKA